MIHHSLDECRKAIARYRRKYNYVKKHASMQDPKLMEFFLKFCQQVLLDLADLTGRAQKRGVKDFKELDRQKEKAWNFYFAVRDRIKKLHYYRLIEKYDIK